MLVIAHIPAKITMQIALKRWVSMVNLLSVQWVYHTRALNEMVMWRANRESDLLNSLQEFAYSGRL
jgi:hypothetical protein